MVDLKKLSEENGFTFLGKVKEMSHDVLMKLETMNLHNESVLKVGEIFRRECERRY